MADAKPFFTADSLHSSIRRKDPSIGVATVYRFLKEKSKNGELHTYRCDGKNIYSVEKRNHAHFICNQCGTTTHFHIGDISAIKDAVKGEICHLQLDVYGICEKCRQNKEARCQ